MELLLLLIAFMPHVSYCAPNW